MCFDLEENEKRCEEIRKFNNQLLELFKADMEGLSSVLLNNLVTKRREAL